MTLPRASLLVATGTLCALSCSRPAPVAEVRATVDAAPLSLWDRPMAQAWPATRSWDEQQEAGYAKFVARLGGAVTRGECRSLGACLRAHGPTPEFVAAAQAGLPAALEDADCADLAYLLRATWAMAQQLPFAYSTQMLGEGEDERFLRGAHSGPIRRWDESATPAALFAAVRVTVHSGMLRTAPFEEQGDFYAVAVRHVHPGDLFYDPGGHVLVVHTIEPEGTVGFIDGHPDRTLTAGRFPASLQPGPSGFGGGFKRWRPLRFPADPAGQGAGQAVRPERARNGELRDRDAGTQWDRARWQVKGLRVGYSEWVRSELAGRGTAGAVKTTKIDPSTELGRRVGWICEQLRSRVEVVGAAQAAGLPLRPHPEALPANIYATGGDWERWATPGRDARLRAEVGALRDFLQSLLPSLPRREQRALAKAWSETAGADSCVVTYHDSAGGAVRLSLDAVLDRLYALSFDPWDCPERRWGAPPGSPELRTCVSDASTGRFYEVERRLRNRLERGWGDPTPPDSGPDQPPLIDFRPLLRRR